MTITGSGEVTGFLRPRFEPSMDTAQVALDWQGDGTTRVTRGASYRNGVDADPLPSTRTRSCTSPMPGPGGATQEKEVRPTGSVTRTPVQD